MIKGSKHKECFALTKILANVERRRDKREK